MSHTLPNITLDSVLNSNCQLCKNKTERKQFQEVDHCGEVSSTVDGLPVRCVGEWAYEKIYRLVQYFGIFAQGMHKKWQGGINYIEICSGPGRCILREHGEEINGTALAILKDSRFGYVDRAMFIDRGTVVVDALNDRIRNLGLAHKAKAVIGDYTDQAGLLSQLNRLRPNCLNLVFIDPTECNVPFKTIQEISIHLKNVDFIINVAGGTDASRNLVSAILDPAFGKVRTKYESFLGQDAFFHCPEIMQAANANQLSVLRQKFAEAYKQELQKLGYCHVDLRAVRHYYWLLFASKSPKGLEFWKQACKYSPDGQKEFILE